MPKKKTGLHKTSCMLMGLLLLSCAVFAQRTVTGKIVNKDTQQPVANATVRVRGSVDATQTDNSGAFSINVQKNGAELEITSIGYETIVIPVAGKTDIGMVQLAISIGNLNEVFVTGYTSQKKKDITGAVSIVNIADMKATPSGSTEALLQGQAAGVTVTTTGAPGGAALVNIRGITSSGNSSPLVLIDGVPGSMHDINANDIQSLQVLKDAGGAAIYGVRGSNGIIIITTKRGTGVPKVSYDGLVGSQRPLSKSWDLANPTQTGIAKWAQYFNDGLTPSDPQYGNGATPVVPYYITPTGGVQGAPNTDLADYNLYTNHITKAAQNGNNWFNDIFKPALIQQHNISVSGGSAKSSFFMSFNYLDQQGTLIETSLQRYSVRINTNFSLADDHIHVGENAFVFYKTNPGYMNAPGVNSTNSINAAYQLPNIIPVNDIAGNFAGGISQGLGNASNPVAIQDRQANNQNRDYQVVGNVFAEVDFLKHFTLRTSAGGTFDNYYFNGFATTPYENAENNTAANLYTETYGQNSSLIWTNTINYGNTIGKHTFSALGGVEYIYNTGQGSNTTRGNYYITDSSNLTVSPNLWTLNFGQASTQTNNSSIVGDNGITTPYQQAIFSVFGRVDYNYDQKYYLSATLRSDNSSVFVPAQRNGIFPSLSAAWAISQESFMSDLTWLNQFKIRGSWGKMGSLNNINPTNAYTLFGQQVNQSYYDINGTSQNPVAGLYTAQYGNPNTTWEQDIITDVGFDASFMNNRFDLSFDWYKKLVSGLLFVPVVPAPNGGALVPFTNSGNVQNTGFDIALTYHGTVNKDLKFDITGTFTSYNNKVVSLPAGTLYFNEPVGAQTITSRIQPGHPLGEFFGYQVIGLFQSADDVAKSPTQQDAAPGRFKYADVNRDGKIDANDRTFFGNPNPTFTAGLNISVNYKNFDLYTFFYTQVGNKIINNVKSSTDFPQLFGNQISTNVAVNSARLINAGGQPTNINDPTAHVANPGTNVPLLEKSANFSNSAVFNSYSMESGSFLRCKNLTIGYSFMSGTLRRMHFDKLRVYVQALNLFTITKYTGLDPELNPGTNTVFGYDNGVYPNNQKTYNLGVSLTIH
jgi:TonB-dependent starch-binding outer membrane protein SusC